MRPVLHAAQPPRIRKSVGISPASIVLLALCLATATAGAGTESLPFVFLEATDGLYYPETVGTIDVRIVISEAPTSGQVRAEWLTQEVSAVDGEDYVGGTGWVTWEIGDAEPKIVSIPIIDDNIYDPTTIPTFEVVLPGGIGVTIHDPWIRPFSILDDEAPTGPLPTAYFDVFSPFSSLVSIAFHEWDQPVELDMWLNVIPAEPYLVSYTVDPDPTVQSVLFDGVKHQTVTIPALAVPPADSFERRTVRILGPLGKAPGGRVDEIGYIGNLCVFCFVDAIKAMTGASDPCDITCWSAAWFCPEFYAHGPASQLSPLDTLRAYRDQILSTTDVGQRFISLLAAHANDAIQAIMTDLYIVPQYIRTMNAWIPALQTLLAGNGDATVINANMALQVNQLLDMLEASAPASLASALSRTRAEIGTDTLVGLTMSELQGRVDQAALLTERAGWGALKAKW